MVRSEVMEVEKSDQELSEKEKERSKRSEREKDRGREKEKSKDRGKSHREKDKEKEREKDKEKDRAKEKERERVKEKEREKDKDREKDKERAKDRGRDRGRDSEKEKDRHRERTGHGHDKEHEVAKDRERHHSGHGRDKDHDSAREKHRDKSPHEADAKKEKSRDTDREKEKERERHGSREKPRDKDEKVKEKHSDRDVSKDEDKEKYKEREKHGAREKTRDKDEKVIDKHADRETKIKDDEKEKESKREREREKERLREKEKEREREKEKEREREKEKERERERDREMEDRERDREKEKDQERQRVSHREHEHKRESEREYDQERQRVGHKEHEHKRESEREYDHRGMDDDHRGPEREHARDSDQPHVSSSDLADRLSRMREERKKANFDRRPGRRGIRASEKPEEVDDIASWVNKSRQLDEKKKAEEREKAARMAKALEEQENEDEDSDDDFQPANKYSAKDLAGLKVRHGLDKVMEGGAIVLTLKDTNILADGDVNDETDELENFELAQQIAREDAYKAAKKVPGKYEDKFNNDMTGNKTILSKYDEAVKEEGVTLDESGGVDEEAQRKLEEVRRRLQHGMGDRLAESLLTITSTVASEYFTQDEMATFKKPKTKKKKKLRKKEKLDLDALEAEAVAEGLGTTDLGSRDMILRRAQMQDDMKAAADARRERYENAVAKAADASRILKEESEAKAMDVDETEEVNIGAEEDEVMQRSLDRARQAALKKQTENTSGPQAIAARLAAAKQELPQAPGDGDAEEGKLIISDTGEFCRSLQLDEALTRRSGPKDVFHEEEEEKEEGELDPTLDEEEAPGTSPVRGGWTEVGDEEMTDAKDIPEMEEESLDEVKEVAAGKGLAGVLQLLKERGSLKETVDWGGRNMDKKKSKLVGIVDESNNVVGQRDILLDRVDEFGRTMTPKEAFRKLSHKFHGKGPGKMKQEKRQKQFQEELKLKQMNAGDTPLMAMEKIREAHSKLRAPYLVISGHIKPGQTSDPRSGFATVEKEPVGSLTPMLGDNKTIGSLTPMLGDKKVAHFLGIKRKPESGSMGPPPNKKPKDH